MREARMASVSTVTFTHLDVCYMRYEFPLCPLFFASEVTVLFKYVVDFLRQHPVLRNQNRIQGDAGHHKGQKTRPSAARHLQNQRLDRRNVGYCRILLAIAAVRSSY